MPADKIPSPSEKDNVHEVTLKQLLLKIIESYKFLISKWKLILSCSIIGGGIGLLYAYQKKPNYTATTTFVLEASEKSSGGGLLSQFSGIASLAGVNASGGGIFQGDNILQLYSSRAMIQKALMSKTNHGEKNQLLIDEYAKITHLKDSWAENADLNKFQFKPVQTGRAIRLQDSILGKVVEDINRRYLSISKPDKKLNIVKVQVTAEDETFAKEFNDQIVHTVNDFYVQTKTKKSLENLFVLQHQTDSVKAVMNSSINRSAQINDATPNLNLNRQTLRAPIQRSQFNAEANRAILAQMIQNLELAKISLRNETPLLQIIDQPVYPLSKIRTSRSISFLIWATIAGLLTAFFLIIRRFLKHLLITD